MTLLTICQAVADETSIPRPSSVANNPATEVQQLFRYSNRAGSQLMKAVYWQALRAERTFTALGAETQTGILPDDFDRFVIETFWDRTNKRLLSGPVGPTQWAGLIASGYANVGQPKFAYRGNAVLISPVPQGGEALAFEYVTKNWASSQDGTPQPSFVADTDTAFLDEELIIRAVKFLYLDGEGLPSAQAAFDFDEYLKLLADNDQPDAGVLLCADIFGGGRHFSGAPTANGSAASI